MWRLWVRNLGQLHKLLGKRAFVIPRVISHKALVGRFQISATSALVAAQVNAYLHCHLGRYFHFSGMPIGNSSVGVDSSGHNPCMGDHQRTGWSTGWVPRVGPPRGRNQDKGDDILEACRSNIGCASDQTRHTLSSCFRPWFQVLTVMYVQVPNY